MKMSLVVDGLRSDVVSVGELGDDTVAEVAERIADLLGRSVAGAHPRPALGRRRRAVGRAARGAGGDPGRRRRRRPGLRGGRARPRRRLTARATCRPASRLRLSEGLKSRVEEGAAARGRLGQRLHRARRSNGGRSANRSRRGPAGGTACAATARPEGSNGHGEDIRDTRAGPPLRARTRSAWSPSRHARTERRSSRSSPTRRAPRSSSSAPWSSARPDRRASSRRW